MAAPCAAQNSQSQNSRKRKMKISHPGIGLCPLKTESYGTIQRHNSGEILFMYILYFQSIDVACANVFTKTCSIRPKGRQQSYS